MTKIRSRATVRSVLAVVAAVSWGSIGCSDVGDDTTAPASPDGSASSGDDGTTGGGGDGAAEAASGGDTGSDATLSGDAEAAPDTAVDESDADAATQPQEGTDADATAGEGDAGTTVVDASVTDTGVGVHDSGGADAEVAEAGIRDAGEDARVADAGADATVADAGEETGTGGGLVPCATPGQSNCVKCSGNTAHGGACTATEAVMVQRDIAKNYISGGQLSADSCYACLFTAGCIDDDKNNDVGQECGDLSGTVGTGAKASETQVQACLDTLSCIFNSDCQNAAAQNAAATDGIGNCFCGPNQPTSTACAAAPTISGGPASSAPNGACAAIELDGFGDTTSTSNTTVLSNFTTNTTGSGMANNIFGCAGSNTGTFACPTCF
jgi:hypothetical protein